MNYLSCISHGILFSGKIWPIFILEAEYHFEKYRSFVALQRRGCHIDQGITNWAPALTTRMTSTNPSGNYYIRISDCFISALFPPNVSTFSHVQGGRGTLAGGDTGTLPTAPSEPRLSNALRKTPRWAWKAKGRSWWPVINNRWLSAVHLQGKFYHFPVWGLGNLRHHGGEVVCQGALAVTLLFLIY